MTDKDWDDIPYVDGDCIRDENEWNSMIDYIRHSSCTDFIIYGTCPATNQAFRFTQDGTDSQMYGGDDTGDDLHIWGNDNGTAVNIALLNTGEFQIFDGAAQMGLFTITGTVATWEGGANGGNRLKIKCNSANGLSYLNLYGNSGIAAHHATGTYFKVFDNVTEALSVTYAANITTVQGGAVTGDDTILKGNSIDVYSKILIEGDAAIRYYSAAGSYHAFYEGALKFLALYEDGTDDVIEGNTANNDLYLKPNGTGVVKFGTYAAIVAETLQGYVTIKDAGGTLRKVAVVA